MKAKQRLAKIWEQAAKALNKLATHDGYGPYNPAPNVQKYLADQYGYRFQEVTHFIGTPMGIGSSTYDVFAQNGNKLGQNLFKKDTQTTAYFDTHYPEAVEACRNQQTLAMPPRP